MFSWLFLSICVMTYEQFFEPFLVNFWTWLFFDIFMIQELGYCCIFLDPSFCPFMFCFHSRFMNTKKLVSYFTSQFLRVPFVLIWIFAPNISIVLWYLSIHFIQIFANFRDQNFNVKVFTTFIKLDIARKFKSSHVTWRMYCVVKKFNFKGLQANATS